MNAQDELMNMYFGGVKKEGQVKTSPVHQITFKTIIRCKQKKRPAEWKLTGVLLSIKKSSANYFVCVDDF